MKDKHLLGKAAVILGASAKGSIGACTAAAFAARGANVVVAAREPVKLGEIASQIGATAVVCDGGSLADVQQLAHQVREKFGAIDYAVNCVGLPEPAAIADVTEDALDRVVRLNFHTNVFFLQAMSSIMHQGGAITLVSALTADRPILFNAVYSCAKAATECLVKYGALEFASRQVRVNSVIPGFTESAFTAGLLEMKGLAETFAREIPLGRIGRAEDIAEAILGLSEMEYVTGVNLHVNGGNQLTRLPRADEFPVS